MTATGLPPGPTAPPIVQTLRWLLRPVEFLESCRRRYGSTFTLMFSGFGSPMVLISSPEAIRELYSSREHTLPPGRTLSLLPIMGARSLLLLTGPEHLERRKLMLPSFHGERLRVYEREIAALAAAEVAGWAVGDEFAIRERTRAVTLEAILLVVCGITDAERRAGLRVLTPQLLARTGSISLSLRVLAARRLGLRSPLENLAGLRHEIDALFLAEIAERRAGGSDHDDALALLLEARFEDGSAMSDSELRDHLMTLLLAGHETTATALAWAFELLLRNPPVLERLRTALADGDDAYVRAVISESMRLRPIVPLAGRRLGHDLVAGDLVLPAGTDVTPAIWLTHTDPELFPDPYAFRPERFLESAPATYSWIPFGGGVRRCLGAAFAELEMRIVLEAVLRSVELAANGRPEKIARCGVTLTPKHGTRVVVTRRLAAGVPATPSPA